MSIPTDYLNIGDFFFNEIIGDVWLGTITGLVLLFIILASKKQDIHVVILIGCLWLTMVFARYQNLQILWIIVLLVMGGVFYYELNKIMNK